MTLEVHECLVLGKTGEVLGTRGALLDVSEAVHAEELNRRYVADLEYARQRLETDATAQAALVEQLGMAKDRAEAATRAKSDFLSSMSHEIRTPMNGVIGMTELLLSTPLSPEQRGYAETARACGEALLCIINDVLDVSKIEAGKFELETVPFDLHSLLEEVVQLLAVKAHDKRLDLLASYAPEAPREFLGDAGRIRQVVLNLVFNALKFTEHGQVLLGVECKGMADGVARIEVAVHDTGIGIPPDHHGILFQKFQQVDTSSKRRYGGTGLGLAISRQLVELMGGTIGFTSELGEGSSFVFEIPLRLNPEAHQHSQHLSTAELSDIRVLLVAHHQVCHFGTASLCAQWGMRVDTASSGEEAVRMVASARACVDPYGLFCIEHEMPAMDGAETAMRLRTACGRNTPAILLTTSTNVPEELRRTHEAGSDACLVRPVREEVLLNTMRRVLRNSRAAREPSVRVRHPSSVADTPPAKVAPVFTGKRVLVAEDNAVNQRLAAALIGKCGCTVDLASNGLEVLSLAAQFPYDLILMDCQMPEMDGYEATRLLREREGPAHHTSIVAFTASAMPEERNRCLQAGMDAFLSKPVGAKVIWEMLGRYLT